jgi:predicted DNA-binding ribbon-helix-helix protein
MIDQNYDSDILKEIIFLNFHEKKLTNMDMNLTLTLELVTPIQKSIKLNGRSTCLRLERIYWMILKNIAKNKKKTIAKLLSDIEMETCIKVGNVKNFSGLIRATCVIHVLQCNLYYDD